MLADIIAQQNEQSIIIVEVKCFENSTLEDLYTAIGQYLVYRHLIRQMPRDDPICLAIPTTAYYGIFTEIGIEIIHDLQLNLLIVDLDKEKLALWL